MNNNEISMPLLKASTAIAAAASAKADVAGQVIQAAAVHASYDTWQVINAVPWEKIAALAAAAYTMLLMGEWFWKKVWRPLLERWGWLKVKRTRIITIEEYEADNTDKAPL